MSSVSENRDPPNQCQRTWSHPCQHLFTCPLPSPPRGPSIHPSIHPSTAAVSRALNWTPKTFDVIRPSIPSVRRTSIGVAAARWMMEGVRFGSVVAWSPRCVALRRAGLGWICVRPRQLLRIQFGWAQAGRPAASQTNAQTNRTRCFCWADGKLIFRNQFAKTLDSHSELVGNPFESKRGTERCVARVATDDWRRYFLESLNFSPFHSIYSEYLEKFSTFWRYSAEIPGRIVLGNMKEFFLDSWKNFPWISRGILHTFMEISSLYCWRNPY